MRPVVYCQLQQYLLIPINCRDRIKSAIDLKATPLVRVLAEV